MPDAAARGAALFGFGSGFTGHAVWKKYGAGDNLCLNHAPTLRQLIWISAFY